jgi:hypothetical protein
VADGAQECFEMARRTAGVQEAPPKPLLLVLLVVVVVPLLMLQLLLKLQLSHYTP